MGPVQADVRGATGECGVSERRSPGTELRCGKELEGGLEMQKTAEGLSESKKRSAEDEGEHKVELRKKGFEAGGFLGRKKVPHLASSPSTSDGGTDSPGTASPSPTKTAPSPRHKKSDSSGQEYSLWTHPVHGSFGKFTRRIKFPGFLTTWAFTSKHYRIQFDLVSVFWAGSPEAGAEHTLLRRHSGAILGSSEVACSRRWTHVAAVCEQNHSVSPPCCSFVPASW